MKNMARKVWLALRLWYPWVIASLVVLSSNWAATVIFDTVNLWLEGKIGALSIVRLCYVAVFAFSVCLLYRHRGDLFILQTRRLPAELRKHLVLFLSNLRKDLEASGGVPLQLVLTNDLDRDILTMEELKQREPPVKWSWEMPLRGIRHHLDRNTLQTVTLICSPESLLQAHLFLNVCRRYDPLKKVKFSLFARGKARPELVSASDPNVQKGLRGWDFENFDELHHGLSCLLEEFKNRKVADTEVMIDFTGGQKVTSLVAATMTFNRHIKSQYVQTNPDYDVLSYDVVMGLSATPGLEL